tara:strand:- start:302 stop:565 length:264 start_codon:yes stop_codon:yes gene_type:complete
MLSNIVLDIIGCIPISDKEAMDTGIKTKTEQVGMSNIFIPLMLSKASKLFVINDPTIIAKLMTNTSSLLDLRYMIVSESIDFTWLGL